MNKFLTLMAICATVTLPHNAAAAGLGKGEVISPDPANNLQTTLLAVTTTYNFDLITLVDLEKTVTVKFGGKEFEVYPDVYFDYDIAWELGQTIDDPSWGNELIISFNDEAKAEGEPDGIYTIEVPAGIVRNADGELNEANSFSFTKVTAVKPSTVTPEEGMLPEITKVTLGFDAPVSLNPGRGNMEFRVKNDFINPPTYVTSYRVGADGKSLDIDLQGMLKKGVWYMLSLPPTFLRVGELETNAEIWLEYMWWDGMDQAIILSAPTPMSDTDLPPLVLTWDFQPITIAADAPQTEIVIGYPDYGMQDGWRTYVAPSDYKPVYADRDGSYSEPTAAKPANAICIDLASHISNAMGYDVEINVPAGIVTNAEGLTNPPLTYSFMIAGTWPAPTVTPDGLTLNIVWNDADWVSYGMADEEIILTGNEKTLELPFSFGGDDGQVSLNSSYTGLEIELDNLELNDGEYTLVIPEGYVYIDGTYGEFVMNGKVTYQFNLKDGAISPSSKTEIIMVDQPVNTDSIIFDLNGRVVRSGTVEGLAPGIYIIGGKKILLKN